jgi:hypothetical protein
MLRINLLQPQYQKPRIKATYKPQADDNKPLIITAILVVVLALAAVVYLKYRPAKEQKTAGSVPAKDSVIQKSKPEPKKVPPQKAKEIIEKIEDEDSVPPEQSSYTDIDPTGEIEQQLILSKKVLDYLKRITSGGIGFMELTFTAPEDLYVHGTAADTNTFRKFKRSLSKAPFIKIKPGILKPFSKGETIQEFTLNGKLTFKQPSSSTNRVLKPK